MTEVSLPPGCMAVPSARAHVTFTRSRWMTASPPERSPWDQSTRPAGSRRGSGSGASTDTRVASSFRSSMPAGLPLSFNGPRVGRWPAEEPPD